MSAELADEPLRRLYDYITARFRTSMGEPRALHIRDGVAHPYITYVYGHRGKQDLRNELVDIMIREVVDPLAALGAAEIVWRMQPHFNVSDETRDGARRTTLRMRLCAFTADGVPVGLPDVAQQDGAPLRGDYLRDEEVAPNVDETPGELDPQARTEAYPKVDVTEQDVVTPNEDAVLLCAKVCHAAVEAMNAVHNEPTLTWDQSRDSCVAGVRRIIANPAETPEQNHAAWMEYRAAEGWVYGTQKDAAARTHPCMVPYAALGPYQRSKDAIFGAVVRTFFGLGRQS